MDGTSQNSETIMQQTESEVDEPIEMSWNISEQLPETGNCRTELETTLKMFMDALANGSTLAQALKDISFHAYEIVDRLHKSATSNKNDPAISFCNALVRVLETITGINEEVSTRMDNM